MRVLMAWIAALLLGPAWVRPAAALVQVGEEAPDFTLEALGGGRCPSASSAARWC